MVLENIIHPHPHKGVFKDLPQELEGHLGCSFERHGVVVRSALEDVGSTNNTINYDDRMLHQLVVGGWLIRSRIFRLGRRDYRLPYQICKWQSILTPIRP